MSHRTAQKVIKFKQNFFIFIALPNTNNEKQKLSLGIFILYYATFPTGYDYEAHCPGSVQEGLYYLG